MDGAKGEDYFAWKFKLVFGDNTSGKDVIIQAIEECGVEVVREFGNEIYFE